MKKIKQIWNDTVIGITKAYDNASYLLYGGKRMLYI